MPEEFSASLRAGSADFAATVTPAAPDAVRARGNRRRRRQALAAAALALAIAAGGAGTAYASLGRSGLAAAPAGGRTPSATPTGTAAPGRPDIAAVTTKGALVVLDPLSGEARRILVRGGVAGGAVAVSPDGRTVYFAARHGCLGEIESVPVTGGRPRMITPGVRPAVSPDGRKLAFVRQPGTGAAGACGNPPAADQVVVRDLAGGGETVLPAAAHQVLRYPVSLLSWSPDSSRLLVSAGPAQDNEGWQLVGLDPATARYYLAGSASGGSAVPLPGLAGSYYREGVYMPDGDLFVNQVCCAGPPGRVTSSLLLEVSPSGQFVRQVAIGFKDRDHTSLSADPSGHWLLYLSGPDLFLSLDGAAPFKLTTGLGAAAWT